MSKIDLNYLPLDFLDGQSPDYNFRGFGEDSIGIQIEQPYDYRSFLANGLGYALLQERVLQTGNEGWVAKRIIDLQKRQSIFN